MLRQKFGLVEKHLVRGNIWLAKNVWSEFFLALNIFCLENFFSCKQFWSEKKNSFKKIWFEKHFSHKEKKLQKRFGRKIFLGRKFFL